MAKGRSYGREDGGDGERSVIERVGKVQNY